MKVLVTGINGFVGKHLVLELNKSKHTIYGCGLDVAIDSSIEDMVTNFINRCNLTDRDDVARLPLGKIDAIINLAGLAQVGASFGKQELYNKTNIRVHTTLADRMLKECLPIRMISVSSGAVYESNQIMPLTENSKLATSGSPYALSKIAMEESLRPYQDKGLDIVIARPFNHIGPGQLPGFLVPDLYEQIMLAKSDNRPLKVGNLKTSRDFTDVRDVVNAYVKLATADKSTLKHSVYNVCSGASLSGTTVLKLLAEACGVKNLSVEVDPEKIRPNEVMDIYGSSTRIKSDISWKPNINMSNTIKDFVQWRSSKK